MKLNHGYPFWLIKNGLPHTYPRLEQHIKTHVLIIGSGISGALCAYALIKAGIECTLIDERSVGLGSTCASTALLQYELDEPLHSLKTIVGEQHANRVYTMCSNAIDEIESICKTIGFSDFMRKPSLYFSAYKKHKKLIEDEFFARKQIGLKMDLLSEADLINQFGFAAPNAILSEQGACIDAYAFTHQLHQYNIKKGLQLYHRTKAEEITYTKSGVEVVTNNNINIKAHKLINASGYHVVNFIDKDIVKLNSTYALISEQLLPSASSWAKEALIWNTDNPYLYLRKTHDNRIIVGGRDEPFYSPTKRDALLDKKTNQLVKDFKALFPDIDLTPEFSWTGTFGSTKDSLPYIGKYTKTPNTYYALGFGGNGITFSVIAANIIADDIVGKKNENAELYRFDR